MADQNTRLDRERIGTPADEDISGFATSEAQNSGYTQSDSISHRDELPRRFDSATGRTASTKADRTREIRAEIEQTREDMSDTVNAIQDRLHPSALASTAVDSLKNAAQDRVRDIADSDTVQSIKSNPLPTAMIGIGVMGLAWLAFGRRGAGNGYQEVTATRDWRTQLKEDPDADVDRGDSRFHPAAKQRIQESPAAGLTTQATRSVRQAQGALRRSWNDNPLLIGAAAAVLGGLVAASIPETDAENRLMGETRDDMFEGVQQAVKDKVGEVHTAATNALEQVQKVAGLTSDTGTGENTQS
jgi:hypothetical protein